MVIIAACCILILVFDLGFQQLFDVQLQFLLKNRVHILVHIAVDEVHRFRIDNGQFWSVLLHLRQELIEIHREHFEFLHNVLLNVCEILLFGKFVPNIQIVDIILLFKILFDETQ